jgi:hypothetical protein
MRGLLRKGGYWLQRVAVSPLRLSVLLGARKQESREQDQCSSCRPVPSRAPWDGQLWLRGPMLLSLDFGDHKFPFPVLVLWGPSQPLTLFALLCPSALPPPSISLVVQTSQRACCPAWHHWPQEASEPLTHGQAQFDELQCRLQSRFQRLKAKKNENWIIF